MDQSPDLVWHSAMKRLCSPLPLSKGTWIRTEPKRCHKHTETSCGGEKLGGSDTCAAVGMNQQLPRGSRQSLIQPRDNRGETRVKWDTASRRLWNRRVKITPLTPFFKHAGVNLSLPRWLLSSSPPRSPEPRGNSHAKKAMRGADLFGTSDNFSCPEQSCGILWKNKFWAYYNTLVERIILIP